MRMHISWILFVLAAWAPCAEAQERPVALPDTALPALPEPPARLARRIERIQQRAATIDRTCVWEEADRGERWRDPRCDDWYEDISRGGIATVHGVGRYLLAEASDHADGAPFDLVGLLEMGVDVGGVWTEPQSLRWHGEVSVPYLLHVAAAELASADPRLGYVRSVLGAIANITGHDVAPLAPWLRWDAPLLTRAIADWSAWFAVHRETPTREWVRDGLEQARQALASADPAQRYAAIVRLRHRATDLLAVRDAARELVGAEALPAEVRSAVARYARTERLLLPRELRELMSR